MEFLKGALIAGLWGCLASVILAFLFVVATISLFIPEWGGQVTLFG